MNSETGALMPRPGMPFDRNYLQPRREPPPGSARGVSRPYVALSRRYTPGCDKALPPRSKQTLPAPDVSRQRDNSNGTSLRRRAPSSTAPGGMRPTGHLSDCDPQNNGPKLEIFGFNVPVVYGDFARSRRF